MCLVRSISTIKLRSLWLNWRLLTLLGTLAFVRSRHLSDHESVLPVHQSLDAADLHSLDSLSVLRIRPQTHRQLKFLRQLEFNSSVYQLDFWRAPSHVNHSVDVMLSSKNRKHIEKQLLYRNIHYEEMIDSVEK